MTLLAPWGLVLVLLALALVATLLPQSRSRHLIGVSMVWALALVGVVAAVVATRSWAVVTEDDLYAAAETVRDEQDGTPGRMTQQRLMALVSDELGRDVVAHPAGEGNEVLSFYDLKRGGADVPVVCVEVVFSPGIDGDVSSSTLIVEREACS